MVPPERLELSSSTLKEWQANLYPMAAFMSCRAGDLPQSSTVIFTAPTLAIKQLPDKMEPILGYAPNKGGLQNLSEPSSTGKMVCPVLDSNQCALSINHDSVESRTVFHSAQDIEMVDARGVEPLSESRKA